MGDFRNASGVPLTHKGRLWSKILDTLVGAAAADGDMIYRSGGLWTRLPIGTNGRLLKAVGGVPAWGALPAVYQDNDLVIDNTTTGATFVDTELVATLTPGTYRFELQNFGTCHQNPDMKQRLHFTGTATEVKWLITSILVGNTSHFNTMEEAFDVSNFYTSTSDFVTTYYGTVKVTVTGDFSYQVAQNSASATPITAAKSGGSLLFWQIG